MRMAARGDRTRHRLSPPTAHVGGERAVVTVGTAIESRSLADIWSALGGELKPSLDG